jgi:hypothetical protein
MRKMNSKGRLTDPGLTVYGQDYCRYPALAKVSARFGEFLASAGKVSDGAWQLGGGR